MNVLATVLLGVVGFIFFILATVGVMALMSLLAMGFWALVFALLAWLLPDMAMVGREALNLGAYAYWQIGAGFGLVFFLFRLAVSQATK